MAYDSTRCTTLQEPLPVQVHLIPAVVTFANGGMDQKMTSHPLVLFQWVVRLSGWRRECVIVWFLAPFQWYFRFMRRETLQRLGKMRLLFPQYQQWCKDFFQLSFRDGVLVCPRCLRKCWCQCLHMAPSVVETLNMPFKDSYLIPYSQGFALYF